MYIIITGLESAGKSSLLAKMNLNRIQTSIPRIGFNVKTVVHKNVTLIAYDLLQESIRSLYANYHENATACVFVVDSNERDPERIEQARLEFRNLMDSDSLKDLPFWCF